MPDPLRKTFSYRLPVTPQNEASVVRTMAYVWSGVEWNTGPVIVGWVSETYGNLQVWAESEAEGRRVIGIALGHMEADEEEGEWIVTRSRSARAGRTARVRATVVSARAGASGQAPHQFLT